MNIPDLIVLVFIVASVAATIIFRKLTIAGAFTGGLMAALLYKGLGVTGIVLLGAFFVAGTLATSLGRRKKERLGIAEKNKGQRTASQVLANGGVAALAGLLAWIFPQHIIAWRLATAASLASASADTLSSELGSIYGKNFYNILTFKKDTCGLDGVISLEGTLWGIAGSLLIAFIYIAAYGYHSLVWWIVLAGFIGNMTDSLLGAALERKGWIKNDQVNFLNTLVAGLIGLLGFVV
ncbi:hypothetical protein A4D02_22745 [Niastella koreensis]|uniref:DUF92 domain-containing protein n=2 Tax=Niastella koreensis TaxID=354356 RepID=G8TEC0_NIAKG|nr:DUF92 domain-containing protein [Niastella koreensis]AEV98330.1 protein of unknown function DUF92 transmembrane [Niastella koreensis GR20-10]OQP53214.1 hypothetical protein A4D02_22745 [Niastella koreensis]